MNDAHNTDGTFAILAAEAIESRKNAWLAEVSAGANVTEACKASGMTPGSLYLWAQTDPELADGLEQAERNRLAQLETKIDDIIERPEEYDTPLKRPTWGNLLMFRTKALSPRYRDNWKVEVNVGVAVGDIDRAADEYFQKRNRPQIVSSQDG